MMPMPPSSACTIAIGARVTVSMLAETIGRFSVMRREQRAGQVDGGRIAPLEDAALRREEEVVERAAAHELEHPAAHGRIDGRKCRHGFILTRLDVVLFFVLRSSFVLVLVLVP